jgi:hypothetical protein
MCKLRTYRKSNRSCDACEQEIVAGSVGVRCFLCDYDLCPGCSSNTSENVESTPGIVTVPAIANDTVMSVVTESVAVSADGHIFAPSLPLIKVFSIFKPRPSSITLETAVQAANFATQTADGNNSTEVVGATSKADDVLRPPPALVSILAPGRGPNRLQLRNKMQSSLMPRASKPPLPPLAPATAAVPTGIPATADLTSEAEAAVQAATRAGVTEVTSLPSRAETTQSPDESHVSTATASPDSPVSRLEAFRVMCRLHPDKKFGVSIGIQCSSPDPLFVDLRVPRTSDNFQFQLAPFGNRDEPTFENPCPVKVDRGWDSARLLGNMKLKNVEVFVQNAQVVRMPRDGSCLYHALIQHTNYGTGANLSILQLRRELVDFVLQHKDLVVHGQPLHTWIKWECQCR